MSRSIRYCIAARAVVLTAAVTLCCALGRGSEPRIAGRPSVEPFRGVVVLRDGGVLSGEITRAGERYVVITTESEINVAAADVTIVCHSLEDAYERQHKAMRAPSAESHLQLADWCLRNGLLAQAAHELAEARNRDPREPKLALLARRLAVLEQARPSQPTSATRPATTGPAELPMQAAADTVQFNMLASDLPDGAVERFTRKVQPVLVNSCATAGCHSMGGSHQFQLDRALLHGMANRRSTMHNLLATLALVDRDQPERSPLLTVPRRAHGGMEEAVIGPHDDKLLLQLVEWVAVVAQQPEQDGMAVVTDSTMDVESVNPAVFAREITLRPPQRLRYGAQLQPVEPKDEFDPEIFNRRDADGGAAAP
ncbi:MAG: hypothetical protein L0Z07_00505 [Planctomycetes bacterium]|nr:hypothetical protein [Planctomycetota bacterium]